MNKAALILVLVVSVCPITEAGVWDWVFELYWPWVTPVSQLQTYYGTMGQVAVNIGPGLSAGTNTLGPTSYTQVGPGMVQSQEVFGLQATAIGGGPGSIGTSIQTATVTTWQFQHK